MTNSTETHTGRTQKHREDTERDTEIDTEIDTAGGTERTQRDTGRGAER